MPSSLHNIIYKVIYNKELRLRMVIMSFIGVPECGNVCAGPVVFSLSAPGPGLPSIKCHNSGPATAVSTGDSGANMYGVWVWSPVGI